MVVSNLAKSHATRLVRDGTIFGMIVVIQVIIYNIWRTYDAMVFTSIHYSTNMYTVDESTIVAPLVLVNRTIYLVTSFILSTPKYTGYVVDYMNSCRHAKNICLPFIIGIVPVGRFT